MTTIPVELRELLERATAFGRPDVIEIALDEIRKLLSEQPQADHSAQDLNMVEQPQAGAGQLPVEWRCRIAGSDHYAHFPTKRCRFCEPLYTAQPPHVDEARRMREALELIADTDPDDGTSWFHDVANAALTQSPKGEEE